MISLIILLPLYFIGIQYRRGGWWNCIIPFTFLTLVVDVILNYTEWVVYFREFPRYGEHTLSVRLKRLRDAPDNNFNNKLSRYLCPILDAIDPTGRHI